MKKYSKPGDWLGPAARHGIALMLGCIERARDRGGHSIYCVCVYIGADGVIG